MVAENSCSIGTAFIVTMEAKTGVTTGISAADRGRTIQVAVAYESRVSDLACHGSVDMARLTGDNFIYRYLPPPQNLWVGR